MMEDHRWQATSSPTSVCPSQSLAVSLESPWFINRESSLTAQTVLPILYNTFATLASLSRIKRMLRKSRLTALTRSDVVNRVIEIDLPRYAVMPLDRFRNRSEYWSLSSHPSAIPGGTWSTFNWRTNTIGMKTQRVEYADQVRQPQVDIAFDELVCYLMDLGAVTDPHGWRLLRSTGLWTPVGCSLMMSPDGREKALTVAPQTDADGNLSLAVNWNNSWTSRDHAHLPPYWVRLPAPTGDARKPKDASLDGAEGKGGGESSRPVTSSEPEGAASEHGTDPSHSGDISCQILATGIVNAFTEGTFDPSTAENSAINIDHIRGHVGLSHGMWFAAAATAYGTTSQTTLWNYKIPEVVLTFARKESIPCGLMVLLGMVDESTTPDWATKYDDNAVAMETFGRRSKEQHAAMNAESRMSPADRQAAQQARIRKEMDQRMQDSKFSPSYPSETTHIGKEGLTIYHPVRDRQRQEQQRAEQRMAEALQSPKWGNKLLAEHCLRWLHEQGEWNASLSIKEIAGFMLHHMVWDHEFTAEICKVLDAWKAWADIGGMKRADFYMVKDSPVMFAQATLLVALIMDTSTGTEGTLAMDLQECMRLWKNVRLG